MNNGPQKPTLFNQWWLVIAMGVLLVAIGAGGLALCCPSISPLRWCLQTALVITCILFVVQRNLRLNPFRNHQRLWAGPGVANWITLARGGLIAILAGFWQQPWPGRLNGVGWAMWIPGIIYITASIGDVLDGFVARLTANQTHFGERLDNQIDALGILVASLLAVGYGQLPDYYLSAGLAYYLLRFAVWLRRKTGRPCSTVKRRKGAKLIAGAQMAFLGIVLLPLLSPSFTHVAAAVILIPFLAGFLLDWQMVCRHEKFNHVH